MDRRTHYILLPTLAVIVIVIAISALRIYGSLASPPQRPTTKGEDMFELLEKSAEKTRTAERVKRAQLSSNIEEVNRAYENSVRELMDVLFQEFGFAEIPTDITETMKERVFRAELKYREDHRGVPEANIVTLINSLASTFGAPDYSRTSPLQVRFMRASLRKYLPNLVAVETQEGRMGLRQPVGTGMNPEVAPVEAAFLTMLMIQQKMLNDDWQQTPDEWVANQKKRSLSRSKAAPRNDSEPQLGESPETGESLFGTSAQNERQRRNDEKRNEMRWLVFRGASTLNSARLNDLVQSSLDTLGIAKVEEVEQ